MLQERPVDLEEVHFGCFVLRQCQVICKNENMCRKLGTAINEGYMLNATNMKYVGATI